jgi:hypothetical protein
MVPPCECREGPTHTDPLARAAFLTARICGRPLGHVDQIAPSSRSTCRTSLAAMRRTQTCRGPITSRVAQNSKHDRQATSTRPRPRSGARRGRRSRSGGSARPASCHPWSKVEQMFDDGDGAQTQKRPAPIAETGGFYACGVLVAGHCQDRAASTLAIPTRRCHALGSRSGISGDGGRDVGTRQVAYPPPKAVGSGATGEASARRGRGRVAAARAKLLAAVAGRVGCWRRPIRVRGETITARGAPHRAGQRHPAAVSLSSTSEPVAGPLRIMIHTDSGSGAGWRRKSAPLRRAYIGIGFLTQPGGRVRPPAWRLPLRCSGSRRRPSPRR